MMVGCLIVATVAFFGTFASAWDMDPRCPGYGNGRRTLKAPIESNMRLFEGAFTEKGKAIDGSKVEIKDNKNLRGVERSSYRQLNDIFNFQVKMYWEEGYCWQDEWDEREWCWECEGAGCGEGDHLWLKKCEDDDDEQRFTYESVDEAIQAVKIKPLDRQDLCWTRTGENEHQLKPCGDYRYTDEVTGLDLQVLIGFMESGRFELHPNGFADETNPDSFKCMTSHHHPKNEELVKAELCAVTRHNRSSRWILLNAEGPSQAPPPTPSSGGAIPAPTPSSGGSTLAPTSSTGGSTLAPTLLTERSTPAPSSSSGGVTLAPTSSSGGATPAPTSSSGGHGDVGPKVEAVSGSYCTPSDPCPQCYGDCDIDDDCQGNLQCYQRDGGQEVPSCSGGEDSHSDTDYCIDPNWGNAPPPAPPPTEAATLPTEAAAPPNWGNAPPPAPPPTEAAALPTEAAAPPPTLWAPDTPEILFLGADYCTEANKCGLCEGDCDTDDDCEGDLICYQRDAGEDILGCDGIDPSKSDYCIYP